MAEKAPRKIGCPSCNFKGWKATDNETAVLCDCAKEHKTRLRRLQAGIPINGVKIGADQKKFIKKLAAWVEENPISILSSKRYKEIQSIISYYVDWRIGDFKTSGLICNLSLGIIDKEQLLDVDVLVMEGMEKESVNILLERMKLKLDTVVLSMFPVNFDWADSLSIPVLIYD